MESQLYSTVRASYYDGGTHFEKLLNDQANTPNDLLRPDNIPLELLTHGGPELKNRLMLLILKIWETKTLPSDYPNANIITIFKKGDRENCSNYRGISLLSIASKIFARILLDRLFILAEDELPESQRVFLPSRGTIDMIFCARQLQEKSLEQQQQLLLRARTKATLTSVRELQYVDDNATPGQTAQDLQRTADIYNTAYERFGMHVNTEKTKALIQHPPGQILGNADVTINEHRLEEVEQFSYLGNILTSTSTYNRLMENEIRAAHFAYGRLRGHVFNNLALTLSTKIMVFRAVVLSTFFYAYEIWTLYRSDIQSLE
ncbi:uncharacterized protein LOC143037754 [Oratosquilla oratoria]|uniref:uncharacterized protein LOC143037754 n=1 Tax=Oratosquilla oratoria TaxID=337810 RepID=UPI003F771295